MKAKKIDEPKPEAEDKVLMSFTGGLPAKMTEAEVQKLYNEEMAATAEDVVPRLAQINILHAGAESFKMPPNETGEEKVIKTFRGIIIDKHRCNAYWEQAFGDSGGGVPPNCSSLDAKIGTMDGGNNRECVACRFNIFGSASNGEGEKAKGKACKNMMRIAIMMDGHQLPQRLTLPPSSLRPADEYFSRLIDLGLPMRSIITEFSLVEGKSSEGIRYSQIRLNNGNQISYERFKAIKDFLGRHLAQIRGQEIKTEEYVTPETPENISEEDIENLPETDGEDLPF